MWTGHLAILFGIKSTRLGKEHLRWEPLLVSTFLADVLALFLVLIRIESYSTDFQLVSLYISHSLFTTIMLSILFFMAFSLFTEDKLAPIIYALMPIAAYICDIIAYPFVFGVWSSTSIIMGLHGYNWFNTVYLLFVLELVSSIGLYILFRVKNPHESQSTNAIEIEQKESVPPPSDLKINSKSNNPSGNPVEDVLKDSPSDLGLKSELKLSRLVLKRNDYIVLLLCILLSFPILMKWFL